jgi:hypothetical protein
MEGIFSVLLNIVTADVLSTSTSLSSWTERHHRRGGRILIVICFG